VGTSETLALAGIFNSSLILKHMVSFFFITFVLSLFQM